MALNTDNHNALIDILPLSYHCILALNKAKVGYWKHFNDFSSSFLNNQFNILEDGFAVLHQNKIKYLLNSRKPINHRPIQVMPFIFWCQ